MPVLITISKSSQQLQQVLATTDIVLQAKYMQK